MAKLRTSSSKKNNSIKIIIKKLQKSLLLGKKHNLFGDECEEMISDDNVPEDVKEGHVAVLAMEGEDEPAKRFIVPLSYLTHPKFTRLLEQAAEEYGFDREGALTIPCRPSELEKLLARHDHQGDYENDDHHHGDASSSSVNVNKWTSWNPMVQSC